jgi:hypothetical protein
MERQRPAAISRTKFAAVVVGNCLVGAFFLVMGLLILSGAVTVAGWGEGTLVQRVLVGLLAIAVGGAGLAGATGRLTEGRAGGARVVRSGPFWAGVRVEDGHGEAGFGVGSRDGEF